jgi:hypothetical protein
MALTQGSTVVVSSILALLTFSAMQVPDPDHRQFNPHLISLWDLNPHRKS